VSSSDNNAKPVRDEDAFHVDALSAWLAERGEGPVTEVQQFRGGASNLTYLVRTASTDGQSRDLILRRPPATWVASTASRPRSRRSSRTSPR
jgi:aminoglycoside phosphotransferase (APT) family kinase protein